MIGPDASAFGFAVSSSSASATSSTFSSRSSRFVFCFAETFENCVVPPQSSGCSPSAARSALTRSGFASGMSILLTATTIGTSAARACEIDSLRLRHDAVVGGDDEDGDVRHLRAAGAHGRERLVARRVEERDLAAVDVGLVGADVLGDPAGLGLDDRRLADRVEQRRLAVVDVAHDRDDRRARREILLGVLEDLRQLLLVGGVLDRDLAVQLGADQLDLLVGERLRDLDHLAEAHHDLDDLRRRDAERLREIADGDARRDGRGTGRRRDLLLLALRASRRCGRAPGAGSARLVAALDHDPALPPGRALAGPDRAVWLVRSVSHQRPSSVEARERRVDDDGPPQHAVERAPRPRPLEAGEPPARVDAAPGLRRGR